MSVLQLIPSPQTNLFLLIKPLSLLNESGSLVSSDLEILSTRSPHSLQFGLQTEKYQSKKPNWSVSSMECKSTCLKNCSSTAYAFEDNRCSIWIGDLLNLQQLGQDDTTGNVLYIKLAASEIDSETSPTNTKRVIVVAIVVSTGLLLGLMMFIIMTWRRTVISTELGKDSLVAFGYKDLEKATKNFSEMMGKGGFGSVFKGTLPDRIRLRGFCSEGPRKLLVYDFKPNGSGSTDPGQIFRRKRASDATISSMN
ncbi:hypothetical protein GQ457_03G006010 [Hibiscus cannabinus]